MYAAVNEINIKHQHQTILAPILPCNIKCSIVAGV